MMRVLLARQWREVLDTYRPEHAYRLDVLVWCRIGSALETQPRQPSSLHAIMSYVQKVGVRRVLQKVRSRYGEKNTRDRFLAVGIGRVRDAPDAADTRAAPVFPEGTLVIFIASRHHAAQSRVVVPARRLAPLPASLEDQGDGMESLATMIRVYHVQNSGEDAAVLCSLAGAEPLGPVEGNERSETPEEAFGEAERLLGMCVRGVVSEEHRAAHTSQPPSHTRGERRLGERGAVLFGWGHYARTCLLPNVAPWMEVSSIHEIDAALIPEDASAYHWTTSPLPEGQDFLASAWFLAGYHHHHANLARLALEHDIPVVVEKPLVTNRADLERLLEVRSKCPHVPLFIGFHRRHLLGSWLRRDLGEGDLASPVHCHTIVHEIPLPRHHWYNWPASGSRLLANGSHWIDHFLWLNRGAKVARARARRAPAAQVLVEVELENGALLTLTLSESGSSRGGVRELTEWHRGENTARLVDQHYRFERGDRVVEKERLDEREVYHAMYKSICLGIEAGDAGESLDDIERSWGLMIDLEESL